MCHHEDHKFYVGRFQILTYREAEVWNGDEACPGSFSESAVRTLSLALMGQSRKGLGLLDWTAEARPSIS